MPQSLAQIYIHLVFSTKSRTPWLRDVDLRDQLYAYMATILRNPGTSYSVRYDKVPLQEVANSERTFPADWIAPNGYDVTDDFLRYARPLVGNEMIGLPLVDGRQRLTRFEPVYAEPKLPKYVPQADRG